MNRRRPPSFKIEVPGDEVKKNEFLLKIKSARDILTRKCNKPVNNLDILDTALSFWIVNFDGSEEDNTTTASFTTADRNETEEDMFVVARSSLQRLVTMTEEHAKFCKHPHKVVKTVSRGHVGINTLQCNKVSNMHVMKWSSSPYLPNKKFLVNYRMHHAFICSGMLPVHYTRFAYAAGIGCITKQERKSLSGLHSASVNEAYNSSIEEALLEEIAWYENLDGIDIMTDARHGWRKNAKDSSIVALGEKTHKVLKCVTVTKQDDIVSQRHESVGTAKVYEYLDSKDVSVTVHTHDRNLTINKMVKGRADTLNQNDSWHGVKNVKKAMKAVSSGPLYKEGITWSKQLDDKVEPVATHFHWAIRNCDNDPEKMKRLLIGIVSHYKDEHNNCHPTSRCQTDLNYEPSRKVIVDSKAEKLLKTVIEKSVIYKSPGDYILARDTSYVESFNNVMNIFQDKRIAFSDSTYNTRSMLSVLHWNVNVDREYTSVWNPRDQRAPRRQCGKKNYKALNYKYRADIWNKYMNSIYQCPQRRQRRQ